MKSTEQPLLVPWPNYDMACFSKYVPFNRVLPPSRITENLNNTHHKRNEIEQGRSLEEFFSVSLPIIKFITSHVEDFKQHNKGCYSVDIMIIKFHIA